MRGAFVCLPICAYKLLKARPLHHFKFMRLLFADDNQETHDLFEVLFRIENIEARLTHNGAETVQAVKEAEPFDVMVLDIGMPGMDGWSVFQAIRELPQGQAVPIVIFTGFNAIESNKRAKQLGAADILFKPMMPDDFLSRLRQVIARQA